MSAEPPQPPGPPDGAHAWPPPSGPAFVPPGHPSASPPPPGYTPTHAFAATDGLPPGAPTAWAAAPPRRLADGPGATPPWRAEPGATPPPWQAPPGATPPWPAPPPRRRSGGGLAVVGVAAAVLAGLFAVFALPNLATLQAPGHPRTAAPAPASGKASPSSRSSQAATAAPKPTPTMPSDPTEILEKNPVYALKVPARCRAQSAPASRAAFRSQAKALLACENAAWKKALATSAVEFSKPKVVFYGTRTKSPCGRLGTQFPAAYCTTNRTLYLSTAAYSQGRYYRLAVAQFVLHEYAHHVQALAGIFGSSWVKKEKSATTSRRIELQAHCMAHYQLTHSGLGFSSRDRADAEFQFAYTNDAAGHGSVKAERYWGRRGLAASTIGACNTWKAKPARVK